MKKQLNRGFTLIELLVVIAIIGILAALVLVALGNARNKANDARIKSDIGQLRTLAEVHYDSNSASYVGFGTCVTGTTADCKGKIEASTASLYADMNSAGATAIVANSIAQEFCVSSNLNSNATMFICTDNTGVFKEAANAACGAATVCP